MRLSPGARVADDSGRSGVRNVNHLQAAIPPPPDELSLPPPVGELILRLTAKDPTRRVTSPADLLARLEPLKGLDASGDQPAAVEEASQDLVGLAQ